jgi:hypothetical protein
MFWSLVSALAIGVGLLQSAEDPSRASRRRPSDALSSFQVPDRQEVLSALRRRAHARIAAESTLFSAAELADIETRYASVHTDGLRLI